MRTAVAEARGALGALSEEAVHRRAAANSVREAGARARGFRIVQVSFGFRVEGLGFRVCRGVALKRKYLATV